MAENIFTAPQPGSNRLYETLSQLNVSNPSRIISGIAGTFLLSVVYKHTPKLTLLAGGYLLYRALSGNCPISSLLAKAQQRHAADAGHIEKQSAAAVASADI
ncbi:YgaP family membrane protein [Deminuibacter soli]|uniref:DUF2892 domain-containing protein n=1 Tax=Deminuibacter soli TaxID=2291815 RepID=A0A3E1NEC7_9BACT|nr:DUF2892 domain-containing protein [Deminuibacter soli]RFM26335.1 DUF2892 domain-containing protein [Deminuibacter soli]